ncbi:MAG: PKD domain-containing protein, partial [Phycisphaerae bacterium]
RGAPSVRVVSVGSKQRPFFILQQGPGDQLSLCFAMLPKTRKYFIYYGNKHVGPTKSTWRPQRGVLLEGWRYRGGPTGNLQQALRSFEQAQPLQGRRFVPNIFLGHNPFGPTGQTCHKYTGWLICPRSGRYIFATTSSDASFLLIDDELVVEWPGRHAWRADAKHNAATSLTAGLHKLTYYHINAGRRGGAVAAWQPPGQAKITVIPPKAFAPLAAGRLGDLERYSYRFHFAARVANKAGPVRFDWDFGDGTDAAGAEVDHVYLSPGLYRVTLTARTIGKQSRIVNRIRAQRDWNRVVQPRLDKIAAHAQIIANYPWPKMRPLDLSAAIQLLKRAGRYSACMAAGRAFFDKAEKAKAGLLQARLDELAAVATEELGDPHLALQLCSQLEQRAGTSAVKAHAAAVAGRLWLDELGDVDGAESAFRRVLDVYADLAEPTTVRRARIGLGDVYRRRGEAQKARHHYTMAGTLPSDKVPAVAAGSFARTTEDFIRRGEYRAANQQLDRWEWHFPLAKLAGFSSLLRARLYLAQGQHDRARAEARQLLAVNDRSAYAPQLMMLIADIQIARQQHGDARRTLQRLVRQYPTSPLRAEARKLLQKLQPSSSQPNAG